MLRKDIDLFTKLPEGGYLIFPDKLLKKLRGYRQRKLSDTEAGGALIGCLRRHKKGSLIHVEVTGCIEPKLPDKRTRFGFERLGKHHLSNILQAWSRTGGKESYVGE